MNEQNFFSNIYPDGRSPVPENIRTEYTQNDTVFAWISILMGFIVARAVPISKNSLGMTVTTLCFIALGLVFSRANKLTVTRRSYILAAALAIFSAGFITSANRAIHFCLFLFVFILFFIWVYSCRGLGDGLFKGYALRDSVQAIFCIPFAAMIHFFPSLVPKEKNGKANTALRTVLLILAGLGCALIPTIVIIKLLSYDDGFTAIIDKILDISFLDAIRFICDVVMGFTVATIIFGSLYGSKQRTACKADSSCESGIADKGGLPRILLCAAVTPILAVYVIFFISQWSYYVSAFTGVLPGDLTFADYARSGFFQLCAVSGINAILLLLFNVLIKRTYKKRDHLRSIYSAVISLFTLVLIATAMSKMILYIDSFGLTQKRVYASWLMILLAATFIIVLLGQIFRRIPIFPVIAVTAIVFFALIALHDVDGMIASYNVNAYLSGDLTTVDVNAAEDLGASAVPALARLREELIASPASKDTKSLLQETNYALLRMRTDIDGLQSGLFGFNIPIQRARNIFEGIPIEELHYVIY